MDGKIPKFAVCVNGKWVEKSENDVRVGNLSRDRVGWVRFCKVILES